MRARLLLACLLATAALAAEKPADFAYGMALQTDGKAALYQLELPAPVYRGVAGRGLDDVRVFNAAGEVVPHALRYRTATDALKFAPLALKIFPIYGEETSDLDGLLVDVQRTPAGTVIRLNRQRAEPAQRLRAYLVDASMIEQALHSIELEVQTAAASYVAKATLEASDDLAAWRVVVADAPLVSLEHRGERLEQKRIVFAARKSRYLRISWTGMPDDARLAGARAEVGDASVDSARQWEAVAGHAVDGKVGEYLFDAQGHFPADRFRLDLPQANSVAQFQLLARNRAADPWRLVARGLWYRLNRDGSELVSQPLAMASNADRYWLLRVDEKGGGIGGGEPRLALGWLPQDIVFAARGEGPFTLAFGNGTAKASAYALESLLPAYRSGVGIGTASVISSTKADGPGRSVLDEDVDTKKWILWSCLVGGVLFLAWMAWRLLKQMAAAQPQSKPDCAIEKEPPAA